MDTPIPLPLTQAILFPISKCRAPGNRKFTQHQTDRMLCNLNQNICYTGEPKSLKIRKNSAEYYIILDYLRFFVSFVCPMILFGSYKKRIFFLGRPKKPGLKQRIRVVCPDSRDLSPWLKAPENTFRLHDVIIKH